MFICHLSCSSIIHLDCIVRKAILILILYILYYLFKAQMYKYIAFYFLSKMTYGNLELIEVSSGPICGPNEVKPLIEKKVFEKVNQSILSSSVVENYPTVKIFIKDPRFYEKWVLEGEVGVGTAFANDYFFTNNLDQLLQIIYGNPLDAFSHMCKDPSFPSLEEIHPLLFPRGIIPGLPDTPLWSLEKEKREKDKKDEKEKKDEKVKVDEITTLIFHGKCQSSFLSKITQHILPRHDEIISCKGFGKQNSSVEYLKVEMENDTYIQYLEESVSFFESNEKEIVDKYNASTFRAYKYAFSSLKYLMDKNIITFAKYIF